MLILHLAVHCSTLPNVYVYACNNPSESIVAKRRGYGTIVSHNVPPYGRAGLYKQLTTLKQLLQEYREKPDCSLKGPIIDTLNLTGGWVGRSGSLSSVCPSQRPTVPLSRLARGLPV